MKARFKNWKQPWLLMGLLITVPQALFALSGFTATMDSTNANYSFNYSGSPTHLRIYIDSDKKATTGYSTGGIGADYLIENNMLYKFSGSSQSSWSFSNIGSSNMVKVAPNVKFKIARASIGNPTAMNVIANTSAGDSSGIVAQNLPVAAPAPAPGISNMSATSDATNVIYSFSFSGTPGFLRVFLDTDRNAGTGYAIRGIGANYMIENGNLYKHSGTGTGWSFASAGSSNQVKTVSSVKFTIARSALGSPAGINLIGNADNTLYSAIVNQSLAVVPTPTPTPTTTTTMPPAPAPTTTTTMPPAPTPSPSPTASVSFTPSTVSMQNPERGFFMTTDCRANPVSVAQFQNYKSQYGHTVFNCLFYLREFRSSPLTSAVIQQLQTQLSNARTAGFKLILRLAYTNTDINDAPISVVRGHLDQLAPVFQSNVDVIATVQAGIIGQWAEMSTSANYGGANGPFTATDWANRKAVVDKLLEVVPASRMVATRTPEFKMQPYGSTPLSDSEAFNGSARARVSHYNDCFISSSSDWGTYRGTADREFVKQDSKYLAVSGETCAVAVQNDCSNAVAEMAAMHWSLLHEGYHADVISKWKSQGCYSTIQSRLGYRLQLQNATLSTTARVGGNISVAFNLVNTGFAALYNQRPVQLILRNASTGSVFRLPINADPRRWLPGSTIAVNQTVTLPATIPAGSYEMLLALPDAASSLSTRPEYSIQLANSGVWEASTGFNKLNLTLAVFAN